MKSNDFVINKINELVNSFPSIKCSYEFDKSDDTHTVEILPSEDYNSNQNLERACIEIYNEFSELFPYEGLYFIDDSVLYPVKNPMYVIHGKDYSDNFYFLTVSNSVSIPTLSSDSYRPSMSNLLDENFLNSAFGLKHQSITTYIDSMNFAIDSFNKIVDSNGWINIKDLNMVEQEELKGNTQVARAA